MKTCMRHVGRILVSLMLTGLTATALADIDTGLAGHWMLDEINATTLADVTGNSAGGTIHNDPGDLGSNGVIRTCFSFDGTGDGDKVDTNVTDPIPASGAMSIFAWIKTGVTPSASAYIVNNYLTGLSGRSILAVDDSGKIVFFINSSSVSSDDTVTDDRWHHVGVTRSSDDRVQIWIDGQTNGFPVSLSALFAQTQKWFIGGRAEDDARNFEGLIDDVRLYSRELSAVDVAQLYATRVLTDWVYCKDITVDHTKVQGSTDLTDFPLLVSLASDADLAANTRWDGQDIAFGLPDGATLLDAEVESFNPVTGQLLAWVRVPVLGATASTRIRMYFDGPPGPVNPKAVWSNVYEAVWHMDEAPAALQTNILDSSGFGRHATAYHLTSDDRVAGWIGDAIRFESASNDYLRVVDYKGPTGNMTASLWFQVDDATTQQRLIGNHNGDQLDPPLARQHFWLEVNGDQMVGGIDDSVDAVFTTGGTASDATWHLAHLVFDGDRTLRGFLDGEPVFTISEADPIGYTNPYLDIFIAKKADDDTRFVDGILDELRLSSRALSAEWIKTEHNNQVSPSTFYSLGLKKTVIPRGSMLSIR